MCKLHHFGMKNVKTLLDPTYQILKIAVLSQSFTPGQPMSTTVDIGADAETKGYTMYNYTCTHGERSLMTSLIRVGRGVQNSPQKGTL